jgi:predicted RecB family nuclease
MQRIDGRLVFSPTDLNNFLECEYLTHLDIEVAGGRAIDVTRSPESDLLASKGEAHEIRHLALLEAEFGPAVRVGGPKTGVSWDDAARQTREAMAQGAPVIYQATLTTEGWRGVADFLVRVDSASDLGRWSYEAWDTKLARHARPKHLLQLAYYSDRIAGIQGIAPTFMHIVLGTGARERYRVHDVNAYLRVLSDRFLRATQAVANVTAYPVAHCSLCGYQRHCEDHWHQVDHLSQIASIRRSQVMRMNALGIRTAADLAASTDTVDGIGALTFERLKHQAALQVHFRTQRRHRYDLLPPTPENGFRLLPPPSSGDIYFDMEGFPFYDADGGLEYLFGSVTMDEGTPRFTAFRATDRASEKVAFEQFIDFAWQRLQRFPDLHIYHYAHYEPTTLKRLMTTHATREEELDELLRREAFVDLYQVVRRSMRISHDSYSIKAVRQFFMPDAGKGAVTEGGQSILEFQRWMDTGDANILEAIERYNEEDCHSTVLLHKWLLDRRDEAQVQFGDPLPFRPLPDDRERPVETEPDESAGRRAQLDALGKPWAATLGHLLNYHRREAKPEWWAYFDRRKKSLDDLLEDTEAISYLTPVDEPPVTQARSLIYTLAFPPQEFKLKPDAGVDGPLSEGAAGTIEWIDETRGRLGLRRGPGFKDQPLPEAVMAGGPIPDKAHRAAIVRVAESVIAGDPCYRAVEDILRSAPPRFRSSPGGSIQTLDLDRQKMLVADLDASYLFLQGPPGSGKTWAGARLIVSLLQAGHRVGVTAPSHRAIHNLLEEVEEVAAAENFRFAGIKKRSTSDETAFEHGRCITNEVDNRICETSDAQLIAGTGWLFAREGFDQSLDYLFIDEAGQTSLADAVAVGTAARNIVLLGDPQQLPHVSQSPHPGHSGASVLEHLLGDASTVAEDRGIFLAKSWRMHPDVCRFVSDLSYDGRLESAPACAVQRVTSRVLGGTGLRYVPVEHQMNAQQAPEEARAIATLIGTLLDGSSRVTDRDGRERPLTAADILVVAPYNMQVRALRAVLPADVEVGTVDKFQGREAAVVFFSMTSSTGEDVPRGLEFLFNQNRFNVAVSRAKCLSVVVSSPRLLESRCHTVDQLRLVNAVCRFREEALSLTIQQPLK